MISKIRISQKNIIVIDNASPNQSDAILRKYLPAGVTYIQSGYNGGYAFGNNIGMKKGYQLGFKYLLILNNDISFSGDFITPLVECLNNDDKVAMAGPVYVSSKLKTYGGKNNFYTGKTSLYQTDQNIKMTDVNEFDWILGAVVAFRGDLFKQIGYMDEEYFLNYEENDWQQRAKRFGYKVVLVRKSQVVHQGGGTISNIFGMQEYFMLRNKVIFEFNNALWYQKVFFLIHLTLEITKTILTKKIGIKGF